MYGQPQGRFPWNISENFYPFKPNSGTQCQEISAPYFTGKHSMRNLHSHRLQLLQNPLTIRTSWESQWRIQNKPYDRNHTELEHFRYSDPNVQNTVYIRGIQTTPTSEVTILHRIVFHRAPNSQFQSTPQVLLHSVVLNTIGFRKPLQAALGNIIIRSMQVKVLDLGFEVTGFGKRSLQRPTRAPAQPCAGGGRRRAIFCRGRRPSPCREWRCTPPAHACRTLPTKSSRTCCSSPSNTCCSCSLAHNTSSIGTDNFSQTLTG